MNGEDKYKELDARMKRIERYMPKESNAARSRRRKSNEQVNFYMKQIRQTAYKSKSHCDEQQPSLQL